MERERKSLYIIFYFCILLFRFAQLFMHEFHTFLIKVMEEKKPVVEKNKQLNTK